MLKCYKKTLSDFDFISLRERTHLSMLSSLTGRKIYHTLDPTLLVEKRSLETIMNKNFPLPYYEYVLIFNLDCSMLPLAEKVTKILKLPAIIYNKPPLITYRSKIIYRKFRKWPSFSSLGPREFLALLANAEFIITNSFHGTALSIIFSKPFMTIISGSYLRVGSRILDLLELLKLKDRVFTPENPKRTLSEIIRKPIDYDCVMELLNNARRDSLKLLYMCVSE